MEALASIGAALLLSKLLMSVIILIAEGGKLKA
jgi:hypothetical protein